MRNLLTAERAILESLSRSSKSIAELECDTGISLSALRHIVDELISTDLVEYNDGKYILMCHTVANQSPQELVREKKRLMADFIDSSPNIHLQKVWLTSYERVLFDQLIEKLTHFMGQVKGKREECLKTEFQEVVIWGHSPYQQLIRNSLEL